MQIIALPATPGRAGEFIARLGVVVEEADETELWLEALLKCRLAAATAVEPLYRESCELRAIFVQSLQTARRRTLQTISAFGIAFLVALLRFWFP